MSKATASRRLQVACFGEALWDCLPQGLFLGGASLNAAYHLSRHGVEARLISAVGADFLGHELLQRLNAWGVGTQWVARSPRAPTGVVRARVDRSGVARYSIARGVAWDAIPAPAGARASRPAALLFGTLALRSAANRRALAALLRAWPDAWRVVDLNLRPPFARPQAITFALARAQLLKVNHEEAALLLGLRPTRAAGQLRRRAEALRARFGVENICITAGPSGAGLWWNGQWFWEEGRPVAVADTIGAGDAFLAALMAGLLRQQPVARALFRACRTGEWVASQPGAAPSYKLGGSVR